MSRGWRLERAQNIPRPRDEVFAFFAAPANLERITPAFLRFRILTPPPIAMARGTLIDYRLGLYGIPVRWRTCIESFEPESGFSDVQLSGPYQSWHHRHLFEDAGDGTLMRDVVAYELPFGPLGRLAHALFIRRTLERIFDHRREVIAAIFLR